MNQPKLETFSRPIKNISEWHAKPVTEVLSVFGVSEHGLSESEVKNRRETYGPNQFHEMQSPGLWTHIFAQLRSPLSLVLVVAFLVTFSLGEFIDAGVIAFALLIAVVVGLLQEGKASRAFEKLSASQEKVAVVIRAGKQHEIKAADLVPGDVVVLQDGMQVPADVRIIKSKKLAINEAALTGEWMGVEKGIEPVALGAAFAERASMAWMGTFVASGNGKGIVVATGDNTALGELAQEVQTVTESLTPLQVEMARVSRIMLIIICVLVVCIFIVGLFQGLSFHDMLLTSIAIAVASVPEGLPAAVTIILAVGMEALLKKGGLVRNLLAAETLGSTTFVLTDKTGTLTQARMAVSGLVLADVVYSGESERWEQDMVARDLFDTALCAANAYLDEDSQTGVTYIRGDAVERAILESASLIAISPEGDTARGRRVDYLAFTSENRFAAGVTPYGNAFRLCVNGAPEFLLAAATGVRTNNGVEPLTEECRKSIERAITACTKEGKRLVAVGFKTVSYDDIPDDTEHVLDNLIFSGVVVLADPVRDGVSDAIAGVQSAGARVALVTGDNPETALSIARAVGIADADSIALTGSELEKMSDGEILDVLYNVSVFARVLPKQKMRLAQILQSNGEIVAMTGDGINDAAALRRANIGVSVGSGTAVAKEASDLVLVNDSFATIYAAIEEGRHIISNLRKIIGYLLSTSLSEVVLIGFALCLGAPPPILPAQILWANIIEEGLMSVAFAFERGEKGLMKRRPQDIHAEGILSRAMLQFIASVIFVLSALTITLYVIVLAQDLTLEQVRSTMFLAVAMDSLFIAFAFRSLTTPVWKISLKDNFFFIGSFVLSTMLLIGALMIPFGRTILSYEPLPFIDIALVVSFSIASLLVIEVAKWFFFERPKAR